MLKVVEDAAVYGGIFFYGFGLLTYTI